MMKVRVDFTLDVDAEVIRKLMRDHHETNETLKEFLVSFCSSGAAIILDDHVNSSLSETHTTRVVREQLN
jgi:hypothetical protein